MTAEPNYMNDISQFQELGYLQEINRLILHPCGLALAMANSDAESTTIRIWDYRDDPEGMLFAPGLISQDKINLVAAERKKHAEFRKKLLNGWMIQTPEPM